MEQVNPYGWRVFRPIVRPIVSVIMTIFVYLHTTFDMGYGWVLVVFGVMMRVVLFPLNHKAMRAQLRNMSVQPLVKEIQDRYKDSPEKLQKEMMKLYKEHGFNPLAGCLPMLLPWPVLIATCATPHHATREVVRSHPRNCPPTRSADRDR